MVFSKLLGDLGIRKTHLLTNNFHVEFREPSSNVKDVSVIVVGHMLELEK